ncbi:E3 ubiquitin-protein ligase HACE1-like isoform X2 [Corticium candelabrum]|uniref:E3 ubiquitin-protein ligase HACE1-like isoform X2 n=1 Tax=Corticium candelabrum TaxID=121492 RepID=UPI002E27039E|nr:E3 ubiquitin-protein ligase HACE1-like isoform X2 [Corticium candelabrum]
MSSLFEKNDVLVQAVRRGDIQAVTHVLKMGVDIDTRYEYGSGCVVSYNETLLMIACRNNKKEMVELLLSKSADVNKGDRWGWTALMMAADDGSEDIMNIILKTKDIDVKMGDCWGKTAIHHAAMANHVAIVERLLSCSVPVDIIDFRNRTPLWFAVRGGCVSCVDVLLKHGANPRHMRSRGSPLEFAKRRGLIDVIKMMEEAIRLRSHPYMEGHVSVIRHQDQQTIAELQSDIRKIKKELSQSVPESELTKLRKEIQQKEEEIRCLVSALATVSRVASEKVGKGRTTSAEGQMLSLAAGNDIKIASVSEDECAVWVSRVVRAIQNVSSSRWYAIGSACGKTFNQLQQLKSLPDDSDKVQALFDQLAQQMGGKAAADKLLEACNSMANPTYAAVREEMEK